MLFENPPVDISTLPSPSKEEYTPISNDYVLVQLFTLGTTLLPVMLFTIFIIVKSVFGNASNPFLWLAVAVALFLLVGAAQAWLIIVGFKYKGYCIRQHDVLYRRGLIFKRETTIPLSRIQHLEIKRGIFSRMFGLATVQLFTAGSGGIDLRIPGLLLADAEKIKEYLTQAIAHEC